MSSSQNCFMFPGQGSQFVGMGRDLLRHNVPLFTTLIEAGSDFVGCDLKNILLNGPNSLLVKATNLQPLISAVSLGYWSILRDGGVEANIVMGHSLGEITSLGASGVVSPEISVEMAAFRGQMMDMSASLCGDSGMSAVLMASAEDVLSVINEVGLEDSCFMANDNAPNQVVVSGLKSSIEQFESAITAKMRVKVQSIDVAGPWHTPFITPGYNKFKEWVKSVDFGAPSVKFLMNGTASFEDDPLKIKDLVSAQLIKPVYWRESLQQLVKTEGVTIYEMGPSKLLSGLFRANRVTRSLSGVKLCGSVSECRSVLS